MNTSLPLIRPLLLASLFVACAVPVEDGAPIDDGAEEVEATSQAITNGTHVTLESQTDNGVVRVITDTTCSGTLITNRWVLTAAHCFCQTHYDHPANVLVTIYGTQDPVSSAQLTYYSSTATNIIPHPTLDVALVQLKKTLPYAVPAPIYTGSGDSSLVGKNARVTGFGHHRLVNQQPAGHGEGQYTAEFPIHSIVTTLSTNIQPRTCAVDPSYTPKPRPGPRLNRPPGANTATEGGDSGAGVFIGVPNAPQLIGVHAGRDADDRMASTGIWHVRDWIKQTAVDIWTPSECGTTLPNSASGDKPALATGPDGKLHAVAVFGDGSVGHWISDNGKSWSFKNKIAGVSTDTTPALTTELGTQTGQPKKLGLAYKNKSNNVLRYARWSATGGWAAPFAIPTGLTVKGGLSGHNGIIAFTGNDDRAGVTAYDAPTSTFLAAQWAPAAAPRVGIGKNVTVINDPAAQLSLLGWRTDDNRWVQAYGTWSCLFGPTQSYICANDPPYPTDWLQASLAYVSGDRIYLETARATPSFPRHERRTVDGAASYDWGWSHYLVGNEAVSDFNGEVYALRSTFGGALTFSPAGNCFATQF